MSALTPAKRTVTDVRRIAFYELFAALGISDDGEGFTEVHIAVEQNPTSKNRGTVVIVTKTETEVP